MNANKKIISLCTCLLLTISIQAQTSLNLYPLNGAIGVKFFSEKKLSLEPRFDFQFDYANGESNIFMNTELLTTINFLRDENFNMYSGIGLGANIYNQAQSNFSGVVPLGITYYLADNRRMAIIGECGLRITALDFIKMKTYALIGLQIRLSKVNLKTK
jgi:hypothetical protein